jgi:hypothetical protein
MMQELPWYFSFHIGFDDVPAKSSFVIVATAGFLHGGQNGDV